MKKLLIILILTIIAVRSAAQFPNNQSFGSPTTLTTFKGAGKADSGFAIGGFADTAHINLNPYIKTYPGMLVRTANALWMRNSTANAWMNLFGAGGAAVTNMNSGTSLSGTTGQLGGNPLLHYTDIGLENGFALSIVNNGVRGPDQTDSNSVRLANNTEQTDPADSLISPSLIQSVYGWNLFLTASDRITFRQDVLGLPGATESQGLWQLAAKVNNGTYRTVFSIYNDGLIPQNLNIKTHTLGSSGDVTNLQFGDSTFASITSGINDVAIGHLSQSLITTGSRTTSLGSKSLQVNLGSDNTATGYQAGVGNTSATGNSLYGANAYSLNATGIKNVIDGFNGLSNVAFGDRNVSMGANTNSTEDSVSNVIAIGDSAIVSASNQIVIGNRLHNQLRLFGTTYGNTAAMNVAMIDSLTNNVYHVPLSQILRDIPTLQMVFDTEKDVAVMTHSVATNITGHTYRWVGNNVAISFNDSSAADGEGNVQLTGRAIRLFGATASGLANDGIFFENLASVDLDVNTIVGITAGGLHDKRIGKLGVGDGLSIVDGALIVTNQLIGAGNGLTDSAGTIVQGGLFYKTTTYDLNNYSLEYQGANGLTQIFPGGVYITNYAGQTAFSVSTGQGGVAEVLDKETTSTNSPTFISVVRASSTGTVADGFGGSVTYALEAADGSPYDANRLISKWSDASVKTSQFDITGLNSNVAETYMNIQAPGIVRVNNLADTLATKSYARSVGGNPPVPGIDDVLAVAQPFTETRTINTSTSRLLVLGAHAFSLLSVENTDGGGINASAVNGAGVTASSTNDFGINVGSQNSYAAFFQSLDVAAIFAQVLPTVDNTIEPVMILNRSVQGTPTNGAGASMQFISSTSLGSSDVMNELKSFWTNVTTGTRTSQFSITGVSSASAETFANFQTGGIVRVNNLADTLSTKAYVRALVGDGAAAFLPVTGTGTAIGGITGDLDGNQLQVVSGANTIIDLNPASFQSKISATDGTATSSLDLRGDGADPTVSFTLTTTDAVNTVQIRGDAANNNISLTAGALWIQDASLAGASNGYVLTLINNVTGESAWGPGGSSSPFLPSTGTGTATGNITGSLAGNILRIQQGAFESLLIDPTTDAEQSALTAFNNTDDGNFAQFRASTTPTSGRATVTAQFNDGATSAGVSFYADATTSTSNISASRNTIVGDSIYLQSTLSGSVIGWVWTLDDVVTGRGHWAPSSGGGGSVISVSGTSNRITSTGGTTPVIDIAATYVGQTSITTLGTIATGTWNATAISAAKGGTGITSYAVGDLITATGVTTLAPLADVSVGSYLRSGGVTTAPLWSTLKLPNAATANRVVISPSTNTYSESANLTFDGSNLTVGADLQSGHSASIGEMNAAGFIGSSGTNYTSIMPSFGTGSASSGFQAMYFNGTTWISAIEYANTSAAARTNIFLLKSGGNVTIGSASTPTARLMLPAGTTAASSAPMKMTSGPLLTTAEAGAHEFLTDKFYGTITTGAARKEFTLNDAALTSGRVPFITTNGRLTDNAAFTFASNTTLSVPIMTLGTAGSTLGQLILSGNTSQTVTLKTLATAGGYILTMPPNDGNSGDFLQTDGNGVLTWSATTNFNPVVQTLTDGATITWNVINGGNSQVTLGGTGRTLTITNPVAGYTYTVRIIQDGTGNRTITTWPSGTKWPANGTAPTLTTSANRFDMVTFYYDGTFFYGNYNYNYN